MNVWKKHNQKKNSICKKNIDTFFSLFYCCLHSGCWPLPPAPACFPPRDFYLNKNMYSQLNNFINTNTTRTMFATTTSMMMTTTTSSRSSMTFMFIFILIIVIIIVFIFIFIFFIFIKLNSIWKLMLIFSY